MMQHIPSLPPVNTRLFLPASYFATRVNANVFAIAINLDKQASDSFFPLFAVPRWRLHSRNTE